MVRQLRSRLGGARLATLAPMLAAGLACGAELAALPPGYTWQSLGVADARIAKPPGWQALRSQGKLLPSLTLRPKNGSAQLSVQFVSNLAQTRFRPLSRQLDEVVQALDARDDVALLASDPVERDGFEGYVLRLRPTDGAGDAQLEERRYFASERLDLLVVVSFRAPSSEWAALDRTRRTVLDSLRLR